MRSTLKASLALLLVACATAPTPQGAPEMPTPARPFPYPAAPQGDVVDTYHGVAVPDPYRWLENPDSPETRRWVQDQVALTRTYLDRIPTRGPLKERLVELISYTRFGPPIARGDVLYYLRHEGMEAQPVLMKEPRAGGEAEVVLDPNRLSADGTVSMSEELAFSQDGAYLAYGLSDGGSDWTSWKIRDLKRGQDLPETLSWIKFNSPAWKKDGSGFFYARYPAAENPLEQVNRDQKVYFHRVGTPQAEDVLVYERPDQPSWGFQPAVSEDGSTLLISVWRGTEEKNLVYIQDLTRPGAPLRPLFEAWDAYYKYLGDDGRDFFFTTDLDAPRGRVVAARLDKPGALRQVVPQAAETLDGAYAVGHHIVTTYLKDAHSVLKVWGPHGEAAGTLELPGMGTARDISGTWSDDRIYFYWTSFITPARVLTLDLSTRSLGVFRAPQVDFDPDLYETRQVFYPSRDGTNVPMFLSHRKDLQPTGDVPTLLYGYGGFNVSLTPEFKVERLLWMELGGLYAVANLRGGGEYGRAWHEAGTKRSKQNVFDDFIAAAEFLIHKGWTRPARLAIQGGSNGGLLVGAVMLQRPDLFGACLPAVGVMDMLRYHLFTIGWAWASDYGTSADPGEFAALRAYSPVHNIVPGRAYPATMVSTADHDDRVVPAHSYKFAAALQAAQGGPAPVLIRIDTRAGHGAGKPIEMRIEERADELAFLTQALDLPWYRTAR